MKKLFILIFLLFSFIFTKSQTFVNETFYVFFTAEISSSQKDAIYQFQQNGKDVIIPLKGTGKKLFFGGFFTSGEYRLLVNGHIMNPTHNIKVYTNKNIVEDVTIAVGETYKSHSTSGQYVSKLKYYFHNEENDSIITTNLKLIK